ncbi:MAG: class I SAM-dependent methyltransferase [Clostridia bacterium]|jgi:16S rRNA (guanine1207-N2)-methyltransferase
MEHYYSQSPQTAHDISRISYSVKDIRLELMTDAGVFSKKKVDFGTDLLIRSLPPLDGRVLDLGCGYGVIGISIAAMNPKVHVSMVDINERAVSLTRQNIELNGLENAEAFQSNGFERVEGPFDAIVSNPPIRAGKKVIYPLFEESIRYLRSGGAIYLVIQKKQGAKSAMKKLVSVYGDCEAIEKSGGYWILRSIKASI